MGIKKSMPAKDRSRARGRHSTSGGKVIIEISGHHCHISRQDLDVIYGPGYKLTPIKNLSQSGQFAAKETVTIELGNKKIEGIRILGPERENTQVEISLTEAYELKINPPIAEHVSPNKLQGCVSAEIIGPKGKIKRCSIIITHRHFHLDPKTAKKLGVKDNQLISVKTFGQKSLTFHNTLVRIDPSFKPRVHLDTDEGNAANLKGGEKGQIINLN